VKLIAFDQPREGPPLRRIVVCLVAMVSASIAVASSSFAQEGARPPGRVVMFLIDRSESLGKVADSVLPAITVYCENSRLATEPTAFLSVVFNSAVEKVRIVGDDAGLPTTNVTKFLKDLQEAIGPPAGVSPIDSAFEAALAAMAGLPPDTDVTVVLFSDGQARHDRIRTDLYPPVLVRENDLLDPLRKKGLSQAIIEARRRALHSAGDAEGRDLWKVQDEARQARCIELARAIEARGVRFVSVGFDDFESLRKFHEAAGGAPRDYVVTPPGLVVDAFDKAQIGRFPMVFHDRIEAKPEPGGPVSATVNLDPIARSFVAYTEFSRPITDFDKAVELTATFAGATVKANQAEPDEYSRVCLDSSGKACGVLFRFDGVDEQNTEMTLEFRATDGKVDMPDVILHIDMKPRDDLRPEFRPTTASPKLAPPYKVEPDAPVVFDTLLADEAGNHFAVAGATVLFVHERDGEVGNIETQEVDGEDDVFRSPQVVLKEGVYKEGHELLIEFPRQLLVARVLARVVLAYDFDAGDPGARLSIVDRAIRHGRIGDAIDKVTHTLLVSAEGIEAPLRVAVRVAGLVDEEGN